MHDNGLLACALEGKDQPLCILSAKHTRPAQPLKALVALLILGLLCFIHKQIEEQTFLSFENATLGRMCRRFCCQLFLELLTGVKRDNDGKSGLRPTEVMVQPLVRQNFSSILQGSCSRSKKLI